MTSGPIADIEVAPTLGWPRCVTVDPRIGWPNVPRGTLTWPEEVASLQLLDREDSHGWSEIQSECEPSGVVGSPAVAETTASPSGQVPPEIFAAGTSLPTKSVGGGDSSQLPPVDRSISGRSARGSSGRSVPAISTSGSSVRASSTTTSVFRPPGPRRARFEIDEFATAPDEPDGSSVSRETQDLLPLLPRPAEPRIFVVANQKGGVGKTTTTVNIAAALALGGLSVLVVDLDPQGNASTALGIDHPVGTIGTYEVLIDGATMADHVVDSPEAPGLKVLPATIDLAGAEIELVSIVARENRLLRAVRGYLRDHPTDYVFLDCPPSLGLLTLNALVAATEILIPIQCEYYALEGVSQLMRTINVVKGELNEELRLTTVLLTMHDARTRLAAQVADEVRKHFAQQTLPTVIPRSVRISEAPSYGQTVLTYHPDSAGSVSYLAAAHEIARRGAKENSNS
jgi:chromosome partitioning protein